MISKEEKVLIWGAGGEFRKRIHLLLKNCNIVGVTDNGKIEESYGVNVVPIAEVVDMEFDWLIITPIKFFKEIRQQALAMGIEEKKIVSCKEAFYKISEAKMQSDLEEYSKKYLASDYKELQQNFFIDPASFYLFKEDWCQEAGFIDPYFWQDLWGAERIVASGVRQHMDIGSRLDGFIAHLLAAGVKVTMLDVRPLDMYIPNLNFIQTDATNLENIEDNSVESLSALCSIEHFGLGRYNDPVDPDACFKAFKAIQRVIKPGGYAYISVPVSRKERVCFNAHRIFHPDTVIKSFNEMQLVEFSAVYCLDNKQAVKTFDKVEDLIEPEGGPGLFIFKK